MSEKLLLLMPHTLIDDNGQVVFQYLSDNYDVLEDIC